MMKDRLLHEPRKAATAWNCPEPSTYIFKKRNSYGARILGWSSEPLALLISVFILLSRLSSNFTISL